MMKRKELIKALTFTLSVLVVLAWVTCLQAETNDPAKTGHFFSISAQRNAIDRDDVISAVAITANQSEGRYSILDEIWKPEFKVVPHYHATHSETFYIISGEVEWTVNGEARVLKAGDAVYIPPKAVHSVRVVGGKNLHTLMIYEPGGYEDHIAREQMYTDEQLKDPKILGQLRQLNDFNPVPAKTPVSEDKKNQ